MAQAKKKQATRTKKSTSRPQQARRKACMKTTKKQCVTQAEKMHIYAISAMAIVAGALLCANAVMMIV